MLVLTRKQNACIVIEPAGIRICVVGIDTDNGKRQVRIGIEAPNSQKILREELVDLWRSDDDKRKPSAPL